MTTPASRPLSMQRRCIQVQPETTPGTAMTVGADLWTILAYDSVIKPVVEMEDVEKPGADQYMPSELGARIGEHTFKLRPTAPSANPAWATLPGMPQTTLLAAS